jgi:two-component system response regulator ArlR
MSDPRVLVVEDDPVLARGLSDILRAQGFDVRTAHDGPSGLDAALSGEADLIFLDVMLPKINGYEICRAVRAQGLDVPILMVTAKGQEQEVVFGLNLGADDYVVKPFRVAELLARARAFLRRRNVDRTVTRFGDFELDLRARTLSRNGKPLAMGNRSI